MVTGENQHVNICVRGLMIKEGKLIVAEWHSKKCAFLIGGQVDFGESRNGRYHRHRPHRFESRQFKLHQTCPTHSQRNLI